MTPHRLLPAAVLLLLLPVFSFAADAPGDTLITINGDAITAATMDDMVMAAHASGGAERMNAAFLGKLLDKAVNDLLLLQQAEAMGMGEEPALVDELAEMRESAAASAFASRAFDPEIEISDEEIQEYWRTYYRRIQVRQISARTAEDAGKLREALLAGAPMDSLAMSVSVDNRRHEGGLRDLVIWGDLHPQLRGPAEATRQGELSQVFPFHNIFSVLRVEQKLDPDETAFAAALPRIRRYYAVEKREAAWKTFLEDLDAEAPLLRNAAILERVRGDSAAMGTAAFMEGGSAPAFSAPGVRAVTEKDLRRAIAKGQMDLRNAGFNELYGRGCDEVRHDLILRAAAARRGLLDDPAVAKLVRDKRSEMLINMYLNEIIVPEIVFSREEFDAFYRENLDRFRGPEEVLLDVIVLDDEATAADAAARLAAGGDIDFVRDLLKAGGGGEPSWSPENVFSGSMKEQLAEMKEGDVSSPVKIPSGWMVFKLRGRRQGQPRSIEEVEMPIREAVFQRKFDALMDEHLSLLKERSTIVRHDDRIERYFAGDS